jgi:WXG100 family type VII secretion target
MSDTLSWDKGAMMTGLEEITQAGNTLSAQFESLNTTLVPMGEHWVGQGQESWAAVQKRWNDSMGQMLDVLRQIEQALDRAMSIYGDAENRIVNSWES